MGEGGGCGRRAASTAHLVNTPSAGKGSSVADTPKRNLCKYASRRVMILGYCHCRTVSCSYS